MSNELNSGLTAILNLRNETRADYPGMTDDEIFDAIGRKIANKSRVGAVVMQYGALAIRKQTIGPGVVNSAQLSKTKR